MSGLTGWRTRAAGAAAAALAMLALASATAASAPPVPRESLQPEALTSLARLLGGRPSAFGPHRHVTELTGWREHRASVSRVWAELQTRRVGTIVKWRDGELAPAKPAGRRNLVYPFSGPDFLNAYLFFPGYDQYVMFGLEIPGEVPRLDRMNDADARQMLAGMRAAVNDLVERNYFITERMLKQMNTPHVRGTVPVLLATMGLLDLEVLSVEAIPFPPPETGADGRPRHRPLRGVRIVFRDPARAAPQTLHYLSLDATDQALAHTPEFLAYMEQFRPSTTFIKSASYLLHGPHFTRTRDALFEQTEFLVQDDTGFPYRMLRERGFELRLYGGYERPVRDFGRFGYQPDLELAYRNENPPPLPFPFGYHWEGGRSNLLVARQVAKRP